MPNLPPKTVVANGECADCGKAVQVKLNINGIAYYYCNWPDKNGERCSHHQKWGRAQSNLFQAEYLKSRKQTKESQENGSEPADVQKQPQPAPEQPAREPEPERGESFLYE